MQPTEQWNEAVIQSYIDNQVKENIHLDYKASDALGKSDGKKTELCKDVSAFANSDGGTIIYGVREDKATHLPIEIDGGHDPAEISHEWVEQVIQSNVQPRIADLRIDPVDLSHPYEGRIAYVVTIPKATTTAHQAPDKRYYKRFNFQSVPMEHYELLDVLNRSTAPDLRLTLKLTDEHRVPKAGYEVVVDPNAEWSQPVFLSVSIRNLALQPAEYSVIKLAVDARLSVASGEFQREAIPGTVTVGAQILPTTNLSRNLHLVGAMPIFGDEEWDLTVNPIQLAVSAGDVARSHASALTYLIGWKLSAPKMLPRSGAVQLILSRGQLFLQEVATPTPAVQT